MLSLYCDTQLQSITWKSDTLTITVVSHVFTNLDITNSIHGEDICLGIFLETFTLR